MEKEVKSTVQWDLRNMIKFIKENKANLLKKEKVLVTATIRFHKLLNVVAVQFIIKKYLQIKLFILSK